MDIFQRFSTSILPKDNKILYDVKGYINWDTNSGEYHFIPRNSDDVTKRTYCLTAEPEELSIEM